MNAFSNSDTARPVCRICQCRLDPNEGDHMTRLVCASCASRPEARRMGQDLPAATGTAMPPARDFTVAERAMITKLHANIPADMLLSLLNERLRCDLGPDASPYTMEQLAARLAVSAAAIATPPPVAGAMRASGARDWGALRKLIATARRNGVLGQIDETVIADFALIFTLNSKQMLTLKGTLLQTSENPS